MCVSGSYEIEKNRDPRGFGSEQIYSIRGSSAVVHIAHSENEVNKIIKDITFDV